MPRQGRPRRKRAACPFAGCVAATICLSALVGTAAAAEPLPVSAAAAAPPRTATPIEDDAQLHDVQFQGTKTGWAVGDHGVIWHTRDGGATWQLQQSGVTCPLRSICFLTDRIGWIAGGGTTPFTQMSYGVLLQTTDGGATWKAVGAAGSESARRSSESKIQNPKSKIAATSPASSAGTTLPRLTRVKFFSRDEGVVVGDGNDRDPTGVFVTTDGGATWLPLAGLASPGWLAADFVNLEQGALAGPRGRIALASGGRVTAPRVESLGLRGLRALALAPDRSGWLVGDGGLLLRTETAGLVWQAPVGSLPDELRDTCDFRALEVRGTKVWAAGNPGSVIWHTSDSGATWKKQFTRQPVPISAIDFPADDTGFAVGALGAIIQTTDGGQTWRAVRGGGRRVAIMFLQGQNKQVSLAPIVEQSGEWGFRSLVSVVAGDDLTSTTRPLHGFEARLEGAMVLARGSAANVGWQLPLAIPGLDRDPERLVAEWNRRAEGRLEEVLTGSLVRQLRTWRPSVLVLEQPAERDALTKLINDAALKAVERAPDATSCTAHHDLAGLEPWQVSKIYLHLPPGSSGHFNVDPYRYLPRWQQNVRTAAGAAESLLFETPSIHSAVHAYRLMRSQWSDKHPATTAGGFFSGLPITAGSDARRALPPIDEQDLEARQKLAARQRTFAGYADRWLNDPRHAGQVLAQTGELVQGFPASQAALQLAELAERYQAAGQWQLAELTLHELTEKYPDEPAGLKAMQQLVQFWASGEINWRRLKPQASAQGKSTSDPAQVGDAIVLAQAQIQQQTRASEQTIFDEVEDPRPETPLVVASPRSVSAGNVYRKEYEPKMRAWHVNAAAAARKLRERSAALAAAPEVQFPLAAMHRWDGNHTRADEIYRDFAQQAAGRPWTLPAQAELWMLHPITPFEGPVVGGAFATRKPALDGMLDDVCWRDANELRLTSPDRGDAGENPLVFVSRDAEYLYVAASFPRVAGVRTDGAARERRYDEDLRDFDRVTIYLDVDRDRVTWFSFSIDQRGCTTESCWHDASWNPRWLVKVVGDAMRWRVEAAIPLEELGPRPPGRGDAWGLGIVRTIPAVGWQTWPAGLAGEPRAEAFGLLRFD